LNIEKTLILACSIKLNQLIQQLQNQEIFHFITNSSGCCLEDLEALSDLPLEKIGIILDILVHLKVLDKNDEAEYCCNSLTLCYLDLLSIKPLSQDASIEEMVEQCQAWFIQESNLSDLAQRSLMTFVPELLNRLIADNLLIQGSTFLNWQLIEPEQATIIQNTLNRLGWIIQDNPSYLSQDGQAEIDYLRQLQHAKPSNSLLSFFPEAEDLLVKFADQGAMGVMERPTDLRIFRISQWS
jgi:hypothetical protein